MRPILIILLLLKLSFTLSENYVCTLNHTVSLESESVAFVESPNFPRFMTDFERNECFFNFTKNVTFGEIHQRFIFVPTNVVCADVDEDFCPREYVIFENKTVIYFDLKKHNYYNTSLGYSAFQGYVMFDDWGDNDCPLESVSRIYPFQFADESQIIRLHSNYFEFQNRSHPCLWQFSAPNGYGFKISITRLDISKKTFFTVENSTVIITNQNLIRRNFPYYNNDKYLKISLSGNTFDSYQTRMEFEGYISVVKNNFVEVEDNCYTKSTEDRLIWTNIDKDTNGYPNNAYCNFVSKIEPNTEVIVSIWVLIIEDYADHLYFYPEGNESRPIDHNLESAGDIVFNAIDNETERFVLWEFISDGSWNSHGFTLSFSPILCSCANNIMSVSCYDDSVYHLMPTGDDFYCGNLECNFAIKLDSFCSKTHIELVLQISSNEDNADNTDEEIFDIFKFISDDNIQLEINHRNRFLGIWTLYFSTTTNNSFHALTVPSFTHRHFELTFSTFNVPTNISTIELTESSPYYSFYLCPNVMPFFFEIKLSSDLIKKNATIDMHSAIENVQDILAFYNNKNLTFRLNFKNCFLSDTPYEIICKTHIQEFFVTQFDVPVDDSNHEVDSCSVILFQASTVYSENCVFENNVFNVTELEKVSISAVSKENKICTIFVLITSSENNYYFKNIWMSPANNSMEIYVGTESKFLVEINSETDSVWQNIVLNALIYTIKIPSNSAIMIEIARYKYYLDISTFPYQSILTSQRYGINKPLLGGLDSGVAAFEILNFTTKFTIKTFNVSSSFICYFDSNGTITPINASMESAVFVNTETEMNCVCLNEDNYCYGPYEFYIFIQTISDNFDATISTTKKVSNLIKTSTTQRIASMNGIPSINIFYLTFFSCFLKVLFFIFC